MFVFCKPASSKKRFLPFRQLNKEFSFSEYENTADLPVDWDLVAKGKAIFLERAFLSIVERGDFSKLLCRYVIVYKNKKPCGILYFQVVDFKAGIFGDLFSRQIDKERSRRLSIFEKYIDANREEVLMRLITCGNNLVSGPYGFLFTDAIAEETAHALMIAITELVSKEDKLKSGISAILIKDFQHSLEPADLLRQKKFSEFNVEPNLIVQIPEGVDSLQAYTDLFSKKYRSRSRSVFKGLEGIEVRFLNLDEIQSAEKEMYALYEQIFEKAKFKLIKLPLDYFTAIKKAYPDVFTVKAYYKEGKMIAFASSLLLHDHTVEAHYIGMDYALNNKHSLYQNILFSMISETIRNNCSRLNLGRTAAEIKTTVGAKPENLICYIRPQNTISRIIQKPFISFLQPGEWIPRNPFKEETANVEQKRV